MSCNFMSCIFTSCNFMSSNFTPCYLVRHFHAFSCPAIWSVFFMSCNFDGPSFSCPSFSVNPFRVYIIRQFRVEIGTYKRFINLSRPGDSWCCIVVVACFCGDVSSFVTFCSVCLASRCCTVSKAIQTGLNVLTTLRHGLFLDDHAL